MSNSDQQIWQEILDGDGRAWESLVRRYQTLVYAVASRAGLSLADVADCFQQTWVLLYQHRFSLKDPDRLSAWLVTTAKREAIRLKRQADRSAGDEHLIDQVSGYPAPDEELEQIETQARLEIALDQLDARCQKILNAFFFDNEDRSYNDIALSFGMAPNSIGPVRRRCLERLKQLLLKGESLGVRKVDHDAL